MNFTFDAEKHQFWVGRKRVLSVTQVLSAAGICRFGCVDEELRIASMERGTNVHWMTQLEDEGALNYRRVPKAMRGYRKAFNTWKKHSGFQTLAVEKKFVSVYGFAGIIDRIGYLPCGTWRTQCVVDIKTGDIQNWVRYQLTPYTVGAADDKPQIAERIRRIALRLSPDGTYNVKEFSRSSWLTDWTEFMAAMKGIKCPPQPTQPNPNSDKN